MLPTIAAAKTWLTVGAAIFAAIVIAILKGKLSKAKFEIEKVKRTLAEKDAHAARKQGEAIGAANKAAKQARNEGIQNVDKAVKKASSGSTRDHFSGND